MATMKARRDNLRACCWLALVLLSACGSEDKGTATNDNATAQCTPPAKVLCDCEAGPSGTRTCQIDGSWSVCACNAAASGGSGGTGALPTGGMSAGLGGASAGMGEAGAVASGGAGGAAGAGDTGGTGAMPPSQVLVPPEDVAQCAGSAPPADGEEVTVLEIRTSDVVPGGFVSQAGTTYACFWVELDMPEKHHIIGWEGAVGTDRTVHHQQVSLGEKPFYLAQQGGLCGLPSVDYTWTGGTTPEWTPALAGFPIGGAENGGKARFLWQVHFEGATTYSGGFNAYVTKNLRKYDSANFEQGDVAGISIPANAAATHVATCTPDMTRMKITHPIYVYASMLHAHLAIRHIKAEHFRDGMLINTFGDQMASGFAGFFDQRFLPHAPCIELLPGDEIVTTCEYMNPFPFEVTGGERTDQEMCTVFMQYFPRLPDNRSNFCGTIDSTGGFNP
jgi:hypothetical protein